MVKKMIICLGLFIAMTLAAPLVPGQTQDNYKVDKLGKGFWRIQAVKGTTSTAYLVEGKKYAFLVDVCSGQEGLKEIVQQLTGSKPVKVALTHGHFDHSGGIKYFSDIYMHVADTGLIPKGVKVNMHYIKDGDVVDLGGIKFKVLSIPGHTPGSVAFYNKAGKYIFTGDGIGSTLVWAHISNDPLTVYLESVKKLEKIKDKIDGIYVGHHEQETVRLTPQYITDMRIVTEKVLAGEIESKTYGNGRAPGKVATWGSASVVYNPDKLR
jgi:glyoxylase-like metal-dependent hydrolase (beta-lactamase superfamily II)